MKINTSITRYDIKNLNAIVDKVSLIKDECKKLKYFADDMAKKANVVSKSFTSENMNRTEEVLKNFSNKLENADKEFNELLESVNEFTNKIKHAWRQW